MSCEDKSFAERPQAAPAEPWDSGRTMSPDPAWPIEARLHWYQVSGHILLLNCSEITRQKAAAAADREAGARLAAVEPQPAPGDPVAVLDDGEVLAMRAYSGGVIVIAFAPGAPAENADRLPDTMAAQCDVPVIAVTSVTALRAWTPAELDGKPAQQPQPGCPDPSQHRDVYGRPLPRPAPELAAVSAPSDIRPREDGRRGLDITCGSCGEDYGTNVTDVDEIECPECEAHRCPHCLTWYGGTS